MTRKRRFIIFFTSAGITSIFITFSLMQREDDPLNNNAVSWLPGNRVKSAIMESKISLSDSVQCIATCHNTSKIQITKGIHDGDVEFNHDRTNVHKAPKTYYIEIPLNNKEYFVLVDVRTATTVVTDFGLLDEKKECNCK
jgi:hypothetical protein